MQKKTLWICRQRFILHDTSTAVYLHSHVDVEGFGGKQAERVALTRPEEANLTKSISEMEKQEIIKAAAQIIHSAQST